MLSNFFLHLQHYLVEVLPALAVGFFLSGLAHEFIPQRWVDRNLGRPGIKPILLSTIVGTMLPICCWGSLPIAIGFYKKGARLGPVLAFLVATPATSISALVVTYRLLGLSFAVFIFFAVILMGVTIGLIGNRFTIPLSREEEKDEGDACPECHTFAAKNSGPQSTQGLGRASMSPGGEPRAGLHKNNQADHCDHKKGLKQRLLSVLKFAYIDMPKDIGLETAIGLLLAAAVSAYVPFHTLIERYLVGGWGYIFSLVFGLLMYICSTATVPLADALIRQGLSVGAGMVLLLAGPVTSYGTILVMRKKFGGKILFMYLTMVSIISLLFGLLYAYWLTGKI